MRGLFLFYTGRHIRDVNEVAMQAAPARATQFDSWVLLPENVGKSYELIAGEIVEKVVSNQKSSRIAGKIYFYIQLYLIEKNIGRLTPPDGGYFIGAERYIPDVGYISRARQPIANDDAYNPLVPDLAVEVISPSDSYQQIRHKVSHYLAAGTVVWVALPETEQIEIYTPDAVPIMLGADDILEGGSILPDFRMDVKKAFAD